MLSFVIWGLVAASLVFWGSRFLVRPAPVPAHAALAESAKVPPAQLVRLFGAPPPEPVRALPEPVVADTRFKLIGVAAPRPGQRSGLALIAVDDRPARALPVGGRVDGSTVVLSISHRQVDLGPSGGPAKVSLSLPAMPEAARGVPPPAIAPRMVVPAPGLPSGHSGGVGPQGMQPQIVPPPGMPMLQPGEVASPMLPQR